MNPRILFGAPIEISVPEAKLPPENLLVTKPLDGDLRRQSFQVYIVGKVLENIWDHVSSSKNRFLESGGVLVGHPFLDAENKGINFIIIAGIIPQNSDNRSIGHFTVEPQIVEQTRQKLKTCFPGLVVVGWYHSHPGHGVFLSEQDMQTVRSIYSSTWQVALVVDHLRGGQIAFFQGPKGKKLSGWFELTKNPYENFDFVSSTPANSISGEDHHLKKALIHQGDIHNQISSPSEKELEQKYQRACNHYNASSFAAALAEFEEIQAVTPNYRDTDKFIVEIKYLTARDKY